jgi:GNAT superfamily N-acetyltransferase
MNDVVIQLGERLEFHEAKYWRDFYSPSSSNSAVDNGLQSLQLNSAQLHIAAGVDILAFNRVIGLGLVQPATPDQIDRIIDRYRAAGARRFFIQLSPQAAPEHLPAWLVEKGFRHHNQWVKLVSRISPPPAVKSDLCTKRIGADQAALFADIIITCFEWTPKLKPMIAQAVGRSRWRHYLAYDGDQPAACGACFIDGDLGALTFAATLPEYRGRGAQSALIARRIYDCADAGCRWLTVDTAEDTPERPVASFRNLSRFGLEIAYRRPNFLYEF